MSLWNLSTPPNSAADVDVDDMDADEDMEGMDDMVDGDRQLTTDSDAIDGGLNDSDLGSPRDGNYDADRATGLAEPH